MTPIFILTGPSGAGKSSVLDRLLKQKALRLKRFVTTTTRPVRPGEKNGRDYWFTDDKTFLGEKRRGSFYESAKVYGRWYGSHKQEMRRLKALGRPIILILNVDGAKTLKRLEPKSTVIFLDAARGELVRRLKARGTAMNDLKRRIATITKEEQFRKKADVLIMNESGDLSRTVANVATIIRARKTKKRG